MSKNIHRPGGDGAYNRKPMITKHSAMEVTADTFREKVASSDVPVLVDWWAQWCGPCRMLSPVMDQLASEYGGRAKVAKVNCDSDAEFARGNAIHSLPTVTLWKDGREVARVVGLRSIAEYRQLIEGNM